ncbi:MAG: ferredoxin [Rhodobiaceae bacterium]|nr:ferredoxin [Rhodobiaceae bacterium]
MTVKITVNVAGCVGHARCAAVAPDVYELDDDGFNTTAYREAEESLRAQAVRGMRACPEKIITIEDEENR